MFVSQHGCEVTQWNMVDDMLDILEALGLRAEHSYWQCIYVVKHVQTHVACAHTVMCVLLHAHLLLICTLSK